MPPTTNPQIVTPQIRGVNLPICISVLGAWKKIFPPARITVCPLWVAGEARARAENAWFGGHQNGLYGGSGNSRTRLTLEVVTAGSRLSPDFCTEALEATHPRPPRSTEEGVGATTSHTP